MKYNLQYFASGEGGEKTEPATPKKLEKAREEGQIAKSQDLVTAVMLLALFLTIKIFVGFVGNSFIDAFKEFYGYIEKYSKNGFSLAVFLAMFSRAMVIIIIASLPFLVAAFAVSLILNVAQIKWQISTKMLMPKLDKLNPVNGFKNMFSGRKAFDLLKATVKIIIICWMTYSSLEEQMGLIVTLYDYSLLEGLSIIGDVVTGIGIKISAILLVIGFVDLFYQKMKFKKDMMMSKQEIKEESKQSEGDPQIKGKIRRKMQEASQRRMMQELPKADVVITNPTHFAVAIKYDKEVDSAPVVIAKGEDYLAQKIKQVARDNGIELYEDKPLARMLYYNVNLGDQIPQELYHMVAEVLAYVYRIKNKQ